MIRKCHYKRKKTSLSGGKLLIDKSLSGSNSNASSCYNYTSSSGLFDYMISWIK